MHAPSLGAQSDAGLAGADASRFQAPRLDPLPPGASRIDGLEKSWGELVDPADLGGCTMLLSVSLPPWGTDALYARLTPSGNSR